MRRGNGKIGKVFGCTIHCQCPYCGTPTKVYSDFTYPPKIVELICNKCNKEYTVLMEQNIKKIFKLN